MTNPRFTFVLSLALLVALVFPLGTAGAQSLQDNDATLWPESQRAFFQDGPGLLLTPEQRTELRGLNPEARARWIQQFLDRDPIPETPVNELREGIARRRKLAFEFPSPTDARFQILFLNGAPDERLIIDCGSVFKPMELWGYPGGVGPDGKPAKRELLVFKPEESEPYKLWLPTDSKRALYTPQMEYWLEQWEELRGRIRAVRFDKQNCKEVDRVDQATGVPGLTGALAAPKAYRIRPRDASQFLAPPADLARWAREAAVTELLSSPSELKLASAEVRFPARAEQRIVSRALLQIGPDAGYKVAENGREISLVVEGIVEQDGRVFDQFRMRFQLPVPKPGAPAVLAVDRPLRPRQAFVMRLKVMDEVGGAEARLTRGFVTHSDPKPEPQPAGLVGGELLPETVGAGLDTLILIPPPADVVVGLWRADAIVTGERIKKLVFLVDGKSQLTRTTPPWSAELRLSRFPTEQTIRVEGYDDKDALVAADEVIINLQRGALAVRIAAPPKGSRITGPTLAKAEIVVPDGRRLETVEFRVNDKTVARLTAPPWEARVAPTNEDLVYLTVVATLDDGSTAEAVRYLKAPEYVEEVEVNLVELYVTVTDRSGALVRNLQQSDFDVLDAGKPQEISKFELVDNLPLTLGVLLDTSGSMAGSLVETQQAASDFLESVMRPKDRAFAVSFARRPRLEMPPTDDTGAVVRAISELQAVGDTALHDALIQSLYYFRGIQGQRALVLLSDGDDNASYMPYKDALEYARRSGVAVYVIGFNLSAFETGLRRKLSEIATETGGRVFWASKADELTGIYKEIENELRSRYLVAFYATGEAGAGGYREVEVKVRKGGLKARTARGYYQ
ncbi:MAG TPA: VWA domain-containing protein [Thermoanaerobaculia bacterium]|nr:VWA domain-containing protein [Thermoanaerobaculia bacterium]